MTQKPDNPLSPDNPITLAPDTIHNPKEPRHFMRLKPVAARVSVRLGDRLLAESLEAIRVLEVGRDFYDPKIYLPAADVKAALHKQDKQTFCPIKGHASYFTLEGDEREVAWSYEETLDCAAGLRGLIAFDPAIVTIEESPAE